MKNKKYTIYLVKNGNRIVFATANKDMAEKKCKKGKTISKVYVPYIGDEIFETIEYENIEGHKVCIRGIYTRREDIPDETYYIRLPLESPTPSPKMDKLNTSIKDFFGKFNDFPSNNGHINKEKTSTQITTIE